MEPRGGKGWQPVANPKRPKTAGTRENRCRALRRLPLGAHSKGGGRRFESVRGLKYLQIDLFDDDRLPLIKRGSQLGSQVDPGESENSLQIAGHVRYNRAPPLKRRSSTWRAWSGVAKDAGKGDMRDRAVCARESWGQVVGTAPSSSDGTVVAQEVVRVVGILSELTNSSSVRPWRLSASPGWAGR